MCVVFILAMPSTNTMSIDLQHTYRSDCNYWYMGACCQYTPIDIAPIACTSIPGYTAQLDFVDYYFKHF